MKPFSSRLAKPWQASDFRLAARRSRSCRKVVVAANGVVGTEFLTTGCRRCLSVATSRWKHLPLKKYSSREVWKKKNDGRELGIVSDNRQFSFCLQNAVSADRYTAADRSSPPAPQVAKSLKDLEVYETSGKANLVKVTRDGQTVTSQLTAVTCHEL